jgi:hypothetical protein
MSDCCAPTTTSTPYHRLGEAALALASLRTQLDQALSLVETYHAAINSVHIAVDPDTPETGS